MLSDIPWGAIGAVLLIVALRTTDVSLMAVRIAFAIDGQRKQAAAIGFLEATVFAVAAALVFTGLDNPVRIVAYGAGFALGQYLGVTVARQVRPGMVTVRIFVPRSLPDVEMALRERGFRVTVFEAHGRDGPVAVLHVVTQRKQVAEIMDVCRPWNGKCFVTVGDEPAATAFDTSLMASVRK